MNNNTKSKIKTSVADLIKPKKKQYSETSETFVADLINSKKKETSETSVNDLVKSQKKHSYTSKASVTSVTNLIKPQKRYFYPCDCICCEGVEVDSRTQEKHLNDENLWKSDAARKNQENIIMARKQKKSSIIHNENPTEVNSNIPKKRKRDNHRTSSPNPDFFQSNNKNPEPNNNNNNNENIHTLFSSNFRIPALMLDNGNDNIDQDYIFQEVDEDDDNSIDQEKENEEDDDNIEQEEEEEEDDDIRNFFAYPKIDDDDNDEEFVMENLNDSIETEIILWAFKFQQRFRLPDIALEALIKFLNIVLTRLNKLQFKNFPKSLYMAKKMLSIFQPKMKLAVCNNCHKLHNVNSRWSCQGSAWGVYFNYMIDIHIEHFL
ncbi:hypothetical protein RclHR1_21980005 [Rhizophagus clarus]|uniref:Transposase domain-containing protein n=1 Tax=Rhizophagus clarus TaxID=94130 RepID=A0A2Z6R985_9GLOM|nr:hypothetical protein RclHR1_21980005 [Rhizophagus clarus]